MIREAALLNYVYESDDTPSLDEILITGLYYNDPEYTETEFKARNSGSSSECSDSDKNTN